MTIKRPKLLLIAGLLLIAWTAWIFRPYPVAREDLVSPDLTSLQEPYQKVEGGIFLDGGTVGIRIIDAEGKVAEFSIPAEGQSTNPRLFHGAFYYRDGGVTEIANPENILLRLHEILRKADGHDIYRDLAAGRISSRWRDYATFLWRRFVSRVY